jgi:hypothetical protein
LLFSVSTNGLLGKQVVFKICFQPDWCANNG